MGSRVSSWEATVMIHTRDNNILDWGGSNGVVKNRFFFVSQILNIFEHGTNKFS